MRILELVNQWHGMCWYQAADSYTTSFPKMNGECAQRVWENGQPLFQGALEVIMRVLGM